MTLSPLARSVRATLEYFDMFDHPLTLLELARYRYRFPDEVAAGESPLSDMRSALEEIGAGERDGFWHLTGRAAAVEVREHRFRLAERKFRRARRVARWMRLLPGVRMVAVCNSLALQNAGEESDIDLFTVTRPGTLWITRLVVVGALAALGLRPDERSHADKVCMSFFVSERAMDLSRVALAPDDTYLRYWIATLIPLHDAGGVADAFMEANAWILDRVPGAAAPRRRIVTPTPWLARFAGPLLAVFESPARRVQQRAFPQSIRRAAVAGSAVVVSDDMLKFHVDDARREFEQAFRDRVSAFT